MNLQKLFTTQKLLDNRIVDEHKLHGQDLLPQKILALQVELAELAQNWRGFKFWSKDQEPRINIRVCETCGEYLCDTQDSCDSCDYIGAPSEPIIKNPLLEEYCDCLHFILSIGNELDFTIDEINTDEYIKFESVTKQFTESFILNLWVGYEKENINHYKELFKTFLGLGEMLGFTWSEIEKSYYAKNAINHTRQDNKY